MHILWALIIGLVIGAIAKFIVPGKDPGGIIVTSMIGMAGSLLATFLGRLLVGTTEDKQQASLRP